MASSYAPRRRPKGVDAPVDDENPFIETLRGVQDLLGADDQESFSLLRMASQVPKSVGPGANPISAGRPRGGGLPPATATNAAGAARSAGAGLPGSPPATGFVGDTPAALLHHASNVASSPSRGPQGRSDALASIYNRASDAAGGAAPPPSVPAIYLPAEARLLPPSTRISELEDGAAELLLALLRQERQNVNTLKDRAAQEADNSLARSRRTPAEAELSFRRLTSSQSPFGVEKPPGVIEAELSSLATALLSMPPAGQRAAAQLPTSQVPQQVEGLIAACQRHLSTVYRGDRNSARSLNAVRELGQLLTEIERDTQAMALALAAGSGEATGRWASRLGSVSKTLRPTMPDIDSLANLLEMENELIREALRRPPPEALTQMAPRR